MIIYVVTTMYSLVLTFTIQGGRVRFKNYNCALRCKFLSQSCSHVKIVSVLRFVRFAFQWFVQWLIVARSCAGPGSQFELVRASRLRHGGLIL